jgi:hypothetical protein
MEAITGASQILTRTLVQQMIARGPPDILIRAGADGIGGLDFFKAKTILAAAEPVKDEVKRALARALEARAESRPATTAARNATSRAWTTRLFFSSSPRPSCSPASSRA